MIVSVIICMIISSICICIYLINISISISNMLLLSNSSICICIIIFVITIIQDVADYPNTKEARDHYIEARHVYVHV